MGSRTRLTAQRSRDSAHGRARWSLLLAVLLAVLGAIGVPAAQAATFTVDDTGDRADAEPGNGTCEDTFRVPSFCTLRAAVEEANALPGTDRIRVPDGVYELTSATSLDITSNMEILGESARRTIVRQTVNGELGVLDRVFLMGGDATAILSRLTVQGGQANPDKTGPGLGGNILNRGTLLITESTIRSGFAARGGGIANDGGALKIELSTLAGNSASGAAPSNGFGGAIVDIPTNLIPDPITIETSTISGNLAREGAGIFIASGATLNVRNSTITGNDAADRGGGLAFGSGAAAFHGSIVAGNTSRADPSTPNCALGEGTIDSAGFNIENATDCGFVKDGDQQGVDPALGLLADNGGQTDTHAVSVDSVALETGDPDACPAADQRGVSRPQGRTCDVGAYERDFPPDTSITAGPSGPTNDATPTFSFTSDEPSTFECRLDDQDFVGCTSPLTLGPLSDGPYTFEVQARDAEGNVDPTPASRSFTVDTQVPSAPSITDSDPNSPANDNAPELKGTAEAGSTVRLYTTADCSGTVAATGTSTAFASPGLTVGVADNTTTSFRARATDAALNTSSCSSPFTYVEDSAAPDTSIDSGPNGPTNDATPTFAFSSTEPVDATFLCRFDTAPFAACTSAHTSPAALAPGPHTFEVRAQDAALNLDPTQATRSFTVDTAPPDTSIDSGPAGPTNDATPTFTFVSTEPTGATFLCRFDTAPFAACTSAHTSPAALAPGPHTFEVRAQDAALNLDPTQATRSFTVDTAPPDTTIDSGPAGPTNDATPTFTFVSTEPTGATFLCRFDTAPFAACTSAHTSPAALAPGPHTFEVRAQDAALNLDPTQATRSFTVDTAPPDTTIDFGPNGPTNDATPTFTFASTEPVGATFECRVGAQPFAACTSPHTTATIADGARTFEVRARDAAGNLDPTSALRSFTVDTQPPATSIDSGPTGPTTDATPTFAFSSSEPTGATFQCRFDTASFTPCTSAHTPPSPLADGPHTFEVQARDTAGNLDLTPAIRSFTLDTGAPDTTLASGPSGPTNDSTPTFDFTSNESGVTFQCRFDTASFAPCTSPHTPPVALADGPHTFDVQARDAAGNLDLTPATRSFTLDTGVPNTTIDSGPSGLTNDSTPTFDFSSDESGVTFECRVDSEPLAPCATPHTTSPLPDGPHVLEVEAIDAVGNRDSSSASRSFTVDTRPPETTILSGPPELTTDSTPTFEFSADEEGSTFECSIDDGPFAGCASPFTTAALSSGHHTFLVRAIDSSGNVDPSPALGFDTTAALHEFTLIGTAPEDPVLGTSFNLEVDSGDVYVSVPAGTAAARAHSAQVPPGYESPIKGRVFVPLEEARQVPIGSFVDTRFGSSRLTSARNRRGRTQAGRFSAGVFQVLQSRNRRANGLTELRLKGSSFDRCRTNGRASTAQLSQRIRRRLRANANGNFRTRGRHSAATVRGTIWITADRCDGTLTTVKRGKVAVRDFRAKRTILVRAGKKYLAPAPR